MLEAYITWNITFDEDGWSDWMEPKPDSENYCLTIGYANLGERTVGDKYRCQVEVEFEGVKPTEDKDFWFRAQGTADGSWSVGNIWNDGLVSLRDAPEDNVFTYSTVSTITEHNVQANMFELGLRCDYWGNGKFRVRNIEIKKN